MALTEKQLKQLEGMDGINQELGAGYRRKNSPTVTTGSEKDKSSILNVGGDTEKKSVSESSSDAVDRITNFNKALNVGIDMAREQRKDTTLDLVEGFAGKGNLKASSFAQVLNSFNNSSAPLESSLLKSATDFAADQEKAKEDTMNEIRKLTLDISTKGASKDTITAMMATIENGDIDTALKIAANSNVDYVLENGVISKKNQTGEDEVIYDASGQVETSGMKASEFKKHIQTVLQPEFYSRLDQELNDAELRQFYEYWMALNQSESQTIRPDRAYAQWLAAVKRSGDSLGIKDKGSTTDKKEEDTAFSVTGIPQ